MLGVSICSDCYQNNICFIEYAKPKNRILKSPTKRSCIADHDASITMATQLKIYLLWLWYSIPGSFDIGET